MTEGSFTALSTATRYSVSHSAARAALRSGVQITALDKGLKPVQTVANAATGASAQVASDAGAKEHK